MVNLELQLWQIDMQSDRDLDNEISEDQLDKSFPLLFPCRDRTHNSAKDEGIVHMAQVSGQETCRKECEPQHAPAFCGLNQDPKGQAVDSTSMLPTLLGQKHPGHYSQIHREMLYDLLNQVNHLIR